MAVLEHLDRVQRAVPSSAGVSRLLTPEDLADLLGVDRETVYRMARRGELPAIKVARHWRFRAERIDRWLRELEGEAPDDRGGG